MWVDIAMVTFIDATTVRFHPYAVDIAGNLTLGDPALYSASSYIWDRNKRMCRLSMKEYDRGYNRI